MYVILIRVIQSLQQFQQRVPVDKLSFLMFSWNPFTCPGDHYLFGEVCVLDLFLLPQISQYTRHAPIVLIRVTLRLSWYVSRSDCPDTRHAPIVLIRVTLRLSWYASRSDCPDTRHAPIVLIRVTLRLSWYASRSDCPDTCHAPIVLIRVTLWWIWYITCLARSVYWTFSSSPRCAHRSPRIRVTLRLSWYVSCSGESDILPV